MTKVLKFVPKRAFSGDVDTIDTDGWRICQQSCQRVLLDVHSRTLKCKDCGRVVDSFEYLHKCAKKQKNMWKKAAEELQLLCKEIDDKKAELESLKRKVRYQKNGKA